MRDIHLFFDVDGVLIKGCHHNPAHRRWWNEDIRKDLGICPDAMAEHFFRPLFPDVIIGRRDLGEALESCKDKLGYSGPARDIIDYWLEKDSTKNDEMIAVVEKLAALEGVGLYMATHQEKNRADHLFHTLGFSRYFRDIFYSARLGLCKDDPAFFRAVEAELGLDPARDTLCLFDDTPVCVEAARAAGWRAVQVVTHAEVENSDVVRGILGAA